MNVKVLVLRDYVSPENGQPVKSGTEMVLSEEAYVDWYFRLGSDVPHDVQKVDA